MIQEIKSGLLSVAYNRFRQVLSKPTPKPLFSKLTKGEKKDLVFVIKGVERHNDDLIGDEANTREMFDKDEADELVAERKRYSKLFTKVLKILK